MLLNFITYIENVQLHIFFGRYGSICPQLFRYLNYKYTYSFILVYNHWQYHNVEAHKSTPIYLIIITSLILALPGWFGLAFLFLYTLPTLGPRWLFFFFFMMALSGTVLPVVYFLNLRFPSTPVANGPVFVRQAMWVGIYGDLIVWLMMGRVFNSARAIFLAIGFIIIEILLRMSERSHWKPKE